MAIYDVGHPAYGVHDIDASLAFYAKLGIHEGFRRTKEDGSLWLLYLHVGGDRFIELFPGGPATNEKGPATSRSYRHLCLLSDDIEADVARLTEAGIVFDTPIKFGSFNNQQAWLSDPDGNSIELMQIEPDSAQGLIGSGKQSTYP
ncbi:MAG: VOC family protein [Thermomicrobiales bacterium]